MTFPAPFLSACLAVLATCGGAGIAGAAEPILRPADVVALVGGEDIAALAEQGELELLLLRAFPAHRLKVRNLAHEGDTVFQQQRDLNYPTVEQQLDQVGATVVIAQFGQMESLGGEAKRAEFADALEKLVARLGAGGKRRIVLVGPTPVEPSSPARPRFQALESYRAVVHGLAQRRELPSLMPGDAAEFSGARHRDGIHLNDDGLRILARRVARLLGAPPAPEAPLARDDSRLAGLIRQKNLLWFHYDRPQNWAFLNGDRTVQPSSRDHRDPSIRWFPEEMKQWLPLVEAQERAIWDLAGKERSP